MGAFPLLRFGGGGGAESTLEELDEPLKKSSSPISEWEGIGRRLLVGGVEGALDLQLGGRRRQGRWSPLGRRPVAGVSSNEVAKVGS
jgi:hypothetical protein